MRMFQICPLMKITYVYHCLTGIGKLTAENYLNLKDKLPFIALRMFNVYGPGQDMENLRQGMVGIFYLRLLTLVEFK